MAKFDTTLLITAALAILVAAIVLSIGIEINQNLEETSANATTYTQANDTFTASNGSLFLETLNHPLMTSGTLRVYLSNSSNKQIHLDNFTVDYTLGTIGLISADTSAFNGSGMNANYDYSDHGLSYNTTQNSSRAMAEFSSWFATIALVVGAAMVLIILGVNFRFKKGL